MRVTRDKLWCHVHNTFLSVCRHQYVKSEGRWWRQCVSGEKRSERTWRTGQWRNLMWRWWWWWQSSMSHWRSRQSCSASWKGSYFMQFEKWVWLLVIGTVNSWRYGWSAYSDTSVKLPSKKVYCKQTYIQVLTELSSLSVNSFYVDSMLPYSLFLGSAMQNTQPWNTWHLPEFYACKTCMELTNYFLLGDEEVCLDFTIVLGLSQVSSQRLQSPVLGVKQSPVACV